MDWPLILAGPIVRRVEPRLVAVWLALREPCDLSLMIWAGAEAAATDRAPDHVSFHHSIRVGDELHIALAIYLIPDAQAPLLPEQIYSYNIALSGADGQSRDLQALGLLEDRAGQVQDGKVLVNPHLALGYAAGMLPTFVLPPNELTDLRLVHGSCRLSNDSTQPDGLAWVDDLIRPARADALKRPHQLFLTGDQIYADDVSNVMLARLSEIGARLLGITHTALDEEPEPKEQLPVGDREWPADAARFPPGRRLDLTKKVGGVSSEDGDSHLLSLGDFCAMYLMIWSAECWPADWLPFEQQDKFLTETQVVIGAEQPPGLSPRRQPDADPQAEERAGRARRRKYAREVAMLERLRAALPKVRRALANVPTYTIFDDHEVTDDWYISQAWRERVLGTPLGRTIIRNGLVAYTVFQGWGNDPRQFGADIPGGPLGVQAGPHKQLLEQIQQLCPPEATSYPARPAADAIDALLALDGSAPKLAWHYQVLGPRHLVVVLDCRTRRGYLRRISAPSNIPPEGLAEQIPPAPLPAGVEQLLVVSSLTVLGPPVIDALLGPLAYRLFDLFSHGNEPDLPGLNPDAIEAWPYEPRAFEALLRRLEPYRKVVLLSGDVHFSASSALSYWKRGDAAPARFAQLTSSGMRNHFRDEARLAGQYLAFMQKVIQADVGVERLGWNERADDLLSIPSDQVAAPALRDLLRQSPVLLPTLGWPAGTAQRDERPPDWAWRAEIVRDDRPEAERPAAARAAPLDPASPDADVAPDRSGYSRVAARHLRQIDNMNHNRQILFASNLGLVSFERRPEGLFVIHELFATYPKANDADDREVPRVYTRHEIALDAAPAPPPSIGGA
jgi:hypothetical protein